MSAERFVPSQPQEGVGSPPEDRRSVGALALAIYLAAFTVPGLGSTLCWWSARAWTSRSTARDLAPHYRRALTIQLLCLFAMVLVQVVVVAVLWLGFPRAGSAELRRASFLAGLVGTAGFYLVMGLLGPILLLAERRRPLSG